MFRSMDRTAALIILLGRKSLGAARCVRATCGVCIMETLPAKVWSLPLGGPSFSCRPITIRLWLEPCWAYPLEPWARSNSSFVDSSRCFGWDFDQDKHVMTPSQAEQDVSLLQYKSTIQIKSKSGTLANKNRSTSTNLPYLMVHHQLFLELVWFRTRGISHLQPLHILLSEFLAIKTHQSKLDAPYHHH